jgi:thiamine-phosphate pyrophosphorylase
MSRDPILCLVTDRPRLMGAGRGFSPAQTLAAIVEQVRAAARVGVHLVQVRERDLEGRPLGELVRGCMSAVQGSRTRVVVNERLDVALACGADGVHLRATSFPAARARAIVPPGFLIGRSVHTAEEATSLDREGQVDYLVAGTIWPSASKPGFEGAGLGVLASITARVSVPVLAIGGVTEARVAQVKRAGAAGIAAIGLFGPDVANAEGVVDATVLGARVDRLRERWTSADTDGT